MILHVSSFVKSVLKHSEKTKTYDSMTKYPKLSDSVVTGTLLLFTIWLQWCRNTSIYVHGADFSSCGDCFCIKDDYNGGNCPTIVPRTNFSDLIPILRALKWSNPVNLLCDPYVQENCTTVPIPLEEGGACVIDLKESKDQNTTCPTGWSYSLRTFPGTFNEAVLAGERVTHSGSCGTCSSLRDLAAYMWHGANLLEESMKCGFAGKMNRRLGFECFKELGFTDGCAAIWNYNANNTGVHCLFPCAPYTALHLPTNGPPPLCKLADCLACDEEQSGPVFARFAGRTRRRSGLLSSIARPCSAIVALDQISPCRSPHSEIELKYS